MQSAQTRTEPQKKKKKYTSPHNQKIVKVDNSTYRNDVCALANKTKEDAKCQMPNTKCKMQNTPRNPKRTPKPYADTEMK
jgi:hypothetical protein